MHRIQTFNQIATRGLDRFPKQSYELGADLDHADAILLRSYKMDAAAINPELKAVARAGAGTNNVPVDACTDRGVVVFNTPGANANAVKELVLCGLLLASRGIVPGIGFASSQTDVSDYSELAKLMEQEKKTIQGQ